MNYIIDAVRNFHQPEEGYRFSVDSLLLANFISCRKARRALDLGAGCGIVGLAALENGGLPLAENLFFLELQPLLVESLNLNLKLYQKRTLAKLTAMEGDWRRLTPEGLGGQVDYVMANPPYFSPREGGRLPGNKQAAQARHELNGSLDDLCQSCARLLREGGLAAMIFPAERLTELLARLTANDLAPRKLRLIHSKLNGPASLAMVESEYSPRRQSSLLSAKLNILPPVVLSGFSG